MKLLEMTTDQAADALCSLAPLIDNIVQDEEIGKTLFEAVDTTGMTTVGRNAAALSRITATVPLLLKGHRRDVFGILAIVNDTTPEAVAAQPVKDTIVQLRDILQDKELTDFFESFEA